MKKNYNTSINIKQCQTLHLHVMQYFGCMINSASVQEKRKKSDISKN